MLFMLESHRLRWTPIQKGTRLRSKNGILWVVIDIRDMNVCLKRLGVKDSKKHPFRNTIWTSRKVAERLLVNDGK